MSTPQPLAVPFTGRKGDRVPNGPMLVTIYPVAGGEPLTTRPVNAKEAVAGGHWSYTPPAPATSPDLPAAKPSGKRGKSSAEVTDG